MGTSLVVHLFASLIGVRVGVRVWVWQGGMLLLQRADR
jgi:hypothetical protein